MRPGGARGAADFGLGGTRTTEGPGLRRGPGGPGRRRDPDYRVTRGMCGLGLRMGLGLLRDSDS